MPLLGLQYFTVLNIQIVLVDVFCKWLINVLSMAHHRNILPFVGMTQMSIDQFASMGTMSTPVPGHCKDLELLVGVQWDILYQSEG